MVLKSSEPALKPCLLTKTSNAYLEPQNATSLYP
jgi:hypothetical protein